MSVVSLTFSNQSYGEEYTEDLFKNDGSKTLDGLNFGDIETGTNYPPRFLYIRHDGLEPIYNTNYFIRTVGSEWGGYVADAEDAHQPYNPNWFRNGGLDPDGDYPQTATNDYDLLRTSAQNNSEMGLRIHYDRSDDNVRTDGLGYDNAGLNFSPILLQSESCDYSGTDDEGKNGYINPEPEDDNKLGTTGDESRLGLSIKMPEDIEGSGHIQFAFAVKYRYTM